jgi:glutathione S-transferase
MIEVIVLLLVGFTIWYVWEKSHRKTHAMPGGIHEGQTFPHKKTWTLYHNEFSLCSKKTRVCLEELGIDYESHLVNLIETGAYENISRQFLAVNPAGLVPVLLHDGHPIYESHQQITYAAAHSSHSSLLVPEVEDSRQVMDYWVHKSSLIGDDPFAAMRETAGNAVPGLTLPIFAGMIAHIPAHRIFEGLLFHRIKQRAIFFLLLKVRGITRVAQMTPLVKLIIRSRDAMSGHMDELESRLAQSEGKWVVGSQFTLADVGMMAIFDRLREGDWLDVFLNDNRPNVCAYWRELQQRPSYQTGVANFAHPLVVKATQKIQALKLSDPAFRSALLDDAA